jgi:hypothetical protein
MIVEIDALMSVGRLMGSELVRAAEAWLTDTTDNRPNPRRRHS